MTPIRVSDRYAALDVVRGMALLGVLLINLHTLFRTSLFEYMSSPHEDLVSRALDTLLEFKSMDLFCLCFGAGIAIQAERDKSVPFLFRRFAVLLAIGLVHLFLIWNGDILTLYAICGFVMILLVRMSSRWLAIAGALIILASLRGWVTTPLPSDAAIRAQADAAFRVYPTGTFLQILKFRCAEAVHFIVPLLIAVLPKTLGLMMTGAAVWKSGIVRTPHRFRGWLLATAVIGLATGLSFESDVPQAFAYGAIILLCAGHLTLFAPLGRMAFTNYIAQSIILTTLFYGYGFGLFGRVSPAQGVAIGLIIYILQLGFSWIWLRTHAFGPAEWAWRSLSYGRRQPWRA